MALQTSGPIDISDLNVELGNPATTQLNLGGASARDLAGVPSGAIRLGADFYGKSSVAYFYHWLRYSTYGNNVTSSAIDSNDNIIYGGYLDYLTFSKTGWVKSYDVDGNLNWSFSRIPGNPGYVTSTKVLVDPSDNVYLIIRDENTYTTVYKFNSSGSLLYSMRYDFGFVDAVIDTSGTYLYFVSGNPMAVHKVNCSNLTYSNGKYNGVTNPGCFPNSIAVSSAGKILVVGQMYDYSSSSSYPFHMEYNSDFSTNFGRTYYLHSPYGAPSTNSLGSAVAAGYYGGTTPVVAAAVAVNYSYTAQWGILYAPQSGGAVTYLKKVSENYGTSSKLTTVGNNLYGAFVQNSPSAIACFVKLSSTGGRSGGYSFTVKDKSGSNVTAPSTLHAGGESSTGFYVFGGGSDAGGVFKAATDGSNTGSFDSGRFTLGTSSTIQSLSTGSYYLGFVGYGAAYLALTSNTSVSTSTPTLSSGQQPSVTSYNI